MAKSQKQGRQVNYPGSVAEKESLVGTQRPFRQEQTPSAGLKGKFEDKRKTTKNVR